jgi:hypothetical protein
LQGVFYDLPVKFYTDGHFNLTVSGLNTGSYFVRWISSDGQVGIAKLLLEFGHFFGFRPKVLGRRPKVLGRRPKGIAFAFWGFINRNNWSNSFFVLFIETLLCSKSPKNEPPSAFGLIPSA